MVTLHHHPGLAASPLPAGILRWEDWAESLRTRLHLPLATGASETIDAVGWNRGHGFGGGARSLAGSD